MPGVPLVLIGRTRHVSWGITASLTDVSDLYREKIRGDQYYLDGQWMPLKIENHKIYIKGNKTVDF
jgi:penicillin amidase